MMWETSALRFMWVECNIPWRGEACPHLHRWCYKPWNGLCSPRQECINRPQSLQRILGLGGTSEWIQDQRTTHWSRHGIDRGDDWICQISRHQAQSYHWIFPSIKWCHWTYESHTVWHGMHNAWCFQSSPWIVGRSHSCCNSHPQPSPILNPQ